MRITTDDALCRVDARWLGVPGWTFPWHPTRYAAYAVGIPIVITVTYLSVHIFGAGVWSFVYGLGIAIVLTGRLMRLVDDEQPASALPPLLWSELGAPRRGEFDSSRSGRWDLSAIAIFSVNAEGKLQPLIPTKNVSKPQRHKSSQRHQTAGE